MSTRNKKSEVVKRLLLWFRTHKRKFPWRQHYCNRNPYAILYAEIMLRRTRADQAGKVFTDFMHLFPSLDRLYHASPSEIEVVLKPLGLYWRNRQIPKLATVLVERYGGNIPQSYKELRSLPGVGEYVATAVMAYAFGGPFVALDTNAMRILSRIFGAKFKPASKPDNSMRKLASSILVEVSARDLNMCLMDFGALVCKPKPRCDICQISDICHYYQTRLQ